jgi:hypothetical protein
MLHKNKYKNHVFPIFLLFKFLGCYTSSEMSASETVVLPLSGAGTTETVPSSVASIDPPTLSIFQA